MKQAILIVAYRNVNHLHRIVDSLGDDYSFYFHIDSKSKISEAEMDRLRLRDNVKLVEKRFKVNWGGLNLTRAILYLAEQALKENEIEYLHVISGADFPIKSSSQITDRISANRHTEHLENFKLPYEFWENGGINRLEYFYLTDVFNAKSFIGKKVINSIVAIQKFLNLKRRIEFNFPTLYGGSTWWSLSASCMRFVVNFLRENPGYLNRFKYTWIADEFFFQTIIMNSKYKEKVENNNLRMIIWESLHMSHPKVLTEDDFININQSTQLFGRKFESGTSDSLLNLLNERNNSKSAGYSDNLLNTSAL